LKGEWDKRLAHGELSNKTHQICSILLNVLVRKFDNIPMHMVGKNDVADFCDHKAEKFSNIASNKYRVKVALSL
jgi:hypothetical protein